MGHSCSVDERVPRRFFFATATGNPPQNKKTDVAEHPEVFDHAGLLVNELPGPAGLFFI
jgi:hypothetical protein